MAYPDGRTTPQQGKSLNFVAKICTGEVDKDGYPIYRPIYIAPDATATQQGDVWLSDATDSNANAANGLTAATPLAVKKVQDNANNKLDKTVKGTEKTEGSIETAGSVKAGTSLTATNNVVAQGGKVTLTKTANNLGAITFDGDGNKYITASYYSGKAATAGTADKANKVANALTVKRKTLASDGKIQTTTTTYDGSSAQTVDLTAIRAENISGTIATGNLPSTGYKPATAGTADKAGALSVSAGGTSLPVYIKSDGKPAAISSLNTGSGSITGGAMACTTLVASSTTTISGETFHNNNIKMRGNAVFLDGGSVDYINRDDYGLRLTSIGRYLTNAEYGPNKHHDGRILLQAKTVNCTDVLKADGRIYSQGNWPVIVTCQNGTHTSSQYAIDIMRIVRSNQLHVDLPNYKKEKYLEITTWAGGNGSDNAIPIWDSDIRLKENIKQSEISALELINQIQHKSFTMKESGLHYNNGYIAQQIETINPLWVLSIPQRRRIDNQEYLTDYHYQINPNTIIPYLSKAIQELSEKNDELEARIAELEK